MEFKLRLQIGLNSYKHALIRNYNPHTHTHKHTHTHSQPHVKTHTNTH